MTTPIVSLASDHQAERLERHDQIRIIFSMLDHLPVGRVVASQPGLGVGVLALGPRVVDEEHDQVPPVVQLLTGQLIVAAGDQFQQLLDLLAVKGQGLLIELSAIFLTGFRHPDLQRT